MKLFGGHYTAYRLRRWVRLRFRREFLYIHNTHLLNKNEIVVDSSALVESNTVINNEFT